MNKKFDELWTVLDSRDQSNAEMQGVVAEYEDQLNKKESVIQQLKQAEIQLREKERTIHAHGSILQDLTSQHQSQLEEKDRVIYEQEIALRDRIEESLNTIRKREAELQDLISRHRSQLDEKDRVIEEQTNVLQSNTVKLQLALEDIQAKDEALTQTKQKLCEHAMQFEETQNAIRQYEAALQDISKQHEVQIEEKDGLILKSQAALQDISKKYEVQLEEKDGLILKSQAELQDISKQHEAELEERDALILKSQAALQELNGNQQKQSEELTAKNNALSTAEGQLAEQATQLLDKESVIREQEGALKAYRLTYGYMPFFRPLARMIRWTGEKFKPRLGDLNQYSPQPLLLDYQPTKRLSNFPSISIVTPSFQQGHFIEKTLRSVIDQHYPALEYFVQDGNSTDATIEILQNYDQHLAGWRSESDSGQSQAINRGLANTKGEIMAWLNSDDLLLPGSLEIVADFFNRHPEVDVVYGNRLLVDDDGMEIGRWILPGHNAEVLSWADFVPQETLFWRREIWDKAGGKIDESFRFAMDWDLLVRFRDAGARFAHIPRFLGAFRIHQEQKTSSAINEVGHVEMNRIRTRVLGRSPSHDEVRKAVKFFMLRHILVDWGYTAKIRVGSILSKKTVLPGGLPPNQGGSSEPL